VPASCPAHAVIVRVPLPESGHRFRDVLLHDGEPRGTRRRRRRRHRHPERPRRAPRSRGGQLVGHERHVLRQLWPSQHGGTSVICRSASQQSAEVDRPTGGRSGCCFRFSIYVSSARHCPAPASGGASPRSTRGAVTWLARGGRAAHQSRAPLRPSATARRRAPFDEGNGARSDRRKGRSDAWPTRGRCSAGGQPVVRAIPPALRKPVVASVNVRRGAAFPAASRSNAVTTPGLSNSADFTIA